jgi:glutamine phosphoribosylpyrophosphate amidotransferase
VKFIDLVLYHERGVTSRELLLEKHAYSLGYLSLEGMMTATSISPNEACVACWNERYPTRITEDAETCWSREREAVIFEA